RDLSRTPVFQVMLALQNNPLPQITLPGITATPYRVDNPTAKYDLVFTLRDDSDSIGGVLEYNSDLFEPETAAQIAGSLVHVLRAMGSKADGWVTDLPVGDAEHVDMLLAGWNRTTPYDPQTCLHDLVARQAAATPEAVAVICDEPRETLTYRELDRRAAQVAHLLRREGVGGGDLVAVLVPRSAAMVVSLLGVLRTGAGFLPLDPEHPPERLQAILDDAGARVAITTRELSGLVNGRTQLRLEPGTLESAGSQQVISHATPGSLAYAVYTSGSTGRPKGVLVEHRAICNNLLWMQHDWPLDGHDRVLQKTTIAFDVAVKEVFWPLLSGAAVVLARQGGQRDPEYLIELINRHRITVAHFVPSMLEAALSYAERTGRAFGPDLEKVMAGAETLPASTLERFFRATEAELLHMYGPTETAIAVTGWTCPRGHIPARVPLGRPMPGVQLYVLGPKLRPVPRGAWGELYAGGVCVARGYLGRPAETAAAFVPDPFSGVPGSRLYRTGDIVRINHRWLLEFRGRLDGQVKVRGFRIELGEVEAVLARHPSVRQAAAVVRSAPDGGPAAIAGFVGTGGQELAPEEIRDHLRASLPDYMIPASLTVLPELPLGANGKIDRGRLPEPGFRPVTRSEPGTPLEHTVADVLSEVLAVADVGVDEDLFTLGGHSLQVPRIAALLAERTGVELPLREIFLYPTVAGIARAVERGGSQPLPAITRVSRATRRSHARPS
ncbi:MAG: non-ribosomal peptide synthetase, partial [Micromonosporaceae bacterium]